MESWKDIPGFEGRYQVSDQGNVRSLDHRVRLVVRGVETTRLSPGRRLRPGPRKSGHLTVAIGKGNSRGVHQLVMEAFVGPCPDGMEVAHNDGDPSHNWLGNLRHATRSNNNQDKAHHGKTRLAPAQVDRIRREAPAGVHGIKSKLAAEFGVSASTISDVLAGRSYSHV